MTWKLCGLAGLLVVVTEALPVSSAADVVQRVAPILVFLAAVTVVAELADLAGVFRVAAHQAATWGRGQVLTLWLLVVVLATCTTVVLSLDTTAVLLTPVVLTLAGQLGLAPLPFALTTAWLANTASLLLPVSNLTNLLAVDRLGWSARTYVSAVWPAALAAIGVTVVVLFLIHHRDLTGRYDVQPRERVEDRTTFVTAGASCVGLALLFVLGVPYWLAATAGAVVLLVAFAVRRRGDLSWSLAPWQLVITVLGLFLAVEAAAHHGGADLLQHAVGAGGSGFADLLRVAGVGAVASNVVNNLPAYLAVEPEVAAVPQRLLALLIGTNTGPLITVWGSLATLLWRDRCRARDVQVSWRRFGVEGLLLVPLTLVAAIGALSLTG